MLGDVDGVNLRPRNLARWVIFAPKPMGVSEGVDSLHPQPELRECGKEGCDQVIPAISATARILTAGNGRTCEGRMERQWADPPVPFGLGSTLVELRRSLKEHTDERHLLERENATSVWSACLSVWRPGIPG